MHNTIQTLSCTHMYVHMHAQHMNYCRIPTHAHMHAQHHVQMYAHTHMHTHVFAQLCHFPAQCMCVLPIEGLTAQEANAIASSSHASAFRRPRDVFPPKEMPLRVQAMPEPSGDPVPSGEPLRVQAMPVPSGEPVPSGPRMPGSHGDAKQPKKSKGPKTQQSKKSKDPKTQQSKQT